MVAPPTRPQPDFWLAGFAIYDHPADFPNHWVTRGFESTGTIFRHRQIGGLCDTLEEARACVPKGLDYLGKQMAEYLPSVYEVWM